MKNQTKKVKKNIGQSKDFTLEEETEKEERDDNDRQKQRQKKNVGERNI